MNEDIIVPMRIQTALMKIKKRAEEGMKDDAVIKKTAQQVYEKNLSDIMSDRDAADSDNKELKKRNGEL